MLVITSLTQIQVSICFLVQLQVGALTVDFSLSDVVVKFISIFSVLVPMLISVNLPLGLTGTLFGGRTVPLGLGLLTNMYNVFTTNDLWGIGLILTSIIGLMIIVSAVMIAVGG
jgi:hypothetical protein